MLAPEKEFCDTCRRKRDLWKVALNKNKAVGMWIRQGPQQHGVYYREDGAVDAEAESECQKSDGRKAGSLTKYTQCVAQILPARFHKGFPAARADDFLADIEASSFQADCAKSFCAAHPAFHLLVGCHLLIGAKLL